MRRSNKLKVPPAVRAAARQAVNTQEIKGLGKPKLQVTDGVAASQMRQQFREQKRPKWLFRAGDMVRVRNPNNVLENVLGMVISVDLEYETLTLTTPAGMLTVYCKTVKLVDRLEDPCVDPTE
jgi:transcription antitermination factor NusG